jgi:hypothetical protein
MAHCSYSLLQHRCISYISDLSLASTVILCVFWRKPPFVGSRAEKISEPEKCDRVTLSSTSFPTDLPTFWLSFALLFFHTPSFIFGVQEPCYMTASAAGLTFRLFVDCKTQAPVSILLSGNMQSLSVESRKTLRVYVLCNDWLFCPKIWIHQVILFMSIWSCRNYTALAVKVRFFNLQSKLKY